MQCITFFSCQGPKNKLLRDIMLSVMTNPSYSISTFRYHRCSSVHWNLHTAHILYVIHCRIRDPMYKRLLYNPVKAHMAVGGQRDLITHFWLIISSSTGHGVWMLLFFFPSISPSLSLNVAVSQMRPVQSALTDLEHVTSPVCHKPYLPLNLQQRERE